MRSYRARATHTPASFVKAVTCGPVSVSATASTGASGWPLRRLRCVLDRPSVLTCSATRSPYVAVKVTAPLASVSSADSGAVVATYGARTGPPPGTTSRTGRRRATTSNRGSTPGLCQRNRPRYAAA